MLLAECTVSIPLILNHDYDNSWFTILVHVGVDTITGSLIANGICLGITRVPNHNRVSILGCFVLLLKLLQPLSLMLY